jgi:AraC-like DNA-binding protein
MRVMSLLGPTETQRLRRAAPSDWIVRETTFAAVLADLATRSGGAILLAPGDIHADAFEELILKSAKAAARLVLCGPESLARHTGLLVRATGTAHVEVIGHDWAAGSAHIIGVLALPERSIPAQVLRLVGDVLLRLPRRAAEAAVRCFTLAPLPASAADLAELAGCDESTLRRHHRKKRICPPARLLVTAGVARACHDGSIGEQDVDVVARAIGCHRRTLDSHLKDVLATTYTRILREGLPPHVAATLAGMVHRS